MDKLYIEDFEIEELDDTMQEITSTLVRELLGELRGAHPEWWTCLVLDEFGGPELWARGATKEEALAGAKVALEEFREDEQQRDYPCDTSEWKFSLYSPRAQPR